MAEITAALVKDLREKSGVGMMDCKKALVETNGDIDAAMDWLRTKGLAKAAKKADRAAAEGLVAAMVSNDGKTGVVIELNAETDFVSKNATFQGAAREVAAVALGVDGDVDAVIASKTSKGETVGDMVPNLIATVGENGVADGCFVIFGLRAYCSFAKTNSIHPTASLILPSLPPLPHAQPAAPVIPTTSGDAEPAAVAHAE